MPSEEQRSLATKISRLEKRGISVSISFSKLRFSMFRRKRRGLRNVCQGITVCHLKDKDGKVYSAWSYCHIEDAWNPTLGSRLALRRAISLMKKRVPAQTTFSGVNHYTYPGMSPLEMLDVPPEHKHALTSVSLHTLDAF